MNEKIFTVTELNTHIKGLIDAQVWLKNVCVQGELTGYKLYPSGHHYFSIKDANSSLKCVMFKSRTSALKFSPSNGMKVLVFGEVSAYERDGIYQLYASKILADGVGDIYVALEQLKEKLKREGLFELSRKRPLPAYPRCIAVITSPAGAAIRDILRILHARYPLVHVRILPVRVQGPESPGEIAAAIAFANRHSAGDLIITGRGGGSMEDLWAFNDERVLYAIANSRIPVISAVGHEPDNTLSDAVADVRAATPSNAAEIAVPDRSDLIREIRTKAVRIINAVNRAIAVKRERVVRLTQSRTMASPLMYTDERRMDLDRASAKLKTAMTSILVARRHRLAQTDVQLTAYNPANILKRGYSITAAGGKILRSVNGLSAGDKVSIRLSDGSFGATINEVMK